LDFNLAAWLESSISNSIETLHSDTRGHSEPYLHIRPVPDVPLPQFNEWHWEISMPVSPVVNNLRSGETQAISDLGSTDK
jgi:hypothetical protein